MPFRFVQHYLQTRHHGLKQDLPELLRRPGAQFLQTPRQLRTMLRDHPQ
jgi:hypothetical protein